MKNASALNTNENKAIGRIEQYYFKNKRDTIYTALEEVEGADFHWGPREIKKFNRLWEKKTPITEIAKEMKRSEIAVFILSLDMIFRGKIKPRAWKIW
jgi:hypothetical protein